jgi:Holliday junction resolvasome RuvABC ATP-dependent DNA helicase subunit
METFLQKNPGLRSRIAFHVPFSDYNPEELMQILELMVKKHSMKLNDNVADKLLPILSVAMNEPDFGNGRYVRNVFERAKMKQASRLISMDVDNITKDELIMLTADDFSPPPANRQKIEKIGFM